MKAIPIGKAGQKLVSFNISILMATRALIQSASGGGKSWLLRLIAEQAFKRKIQIIIVDKEGEFATLREKFGFVLVGKKGETPADPRSANKVAQKLRELRVSAVCDLSELHHQQRHEWLYHFIEGLLNCPKAFWHPCIVIIDEAHYYCPEVESRRIERRPAAKDAVIELTDQGRKRGLCPILATQRISKLDKNATAELLNVMVGPTFYHDDRERAAKEMGIPTRDKEFLSRILKLEPGEFFCVGRAISKEVILVKVGGVETTHPDVSQRSRKFFLKPPPPPEKVKALLPKLADLPKEAEVEAKTKEEMQRRIRELQVQLRQKEREVRQPPAAKVVHRTIQKGLGKRAVRQIARAEVAKRSEEIFAPLAGYLEAIEVAAADAEKNSRSLRSTLVGWRERSVNLRQAAKKAWRHLRRARKHITVKVSVQAPKEQATVGRLGWQPDFRTQPRPRPAQPIPVPATVAAGDSKKIPPGAQRMVECAVQWHPNGLTKGQVAAHAKVKMRGGTYGTYLSMIRGRGLIEVKDGKIYATEAAVEKYGGPGLSAPTTTQEVLDLWIPKLPPGAQRMMDVILQRQGQPVDYETISAESHVALQGGTFGTYLSKLRTAQLVVGTGRRQVAANREVLFL